MKLEWNNIRSRIAQIASYACEASDAPAAFTLGVLGFARRHPFSGRDPLSRLGRYFYPTMRIRTSRFRGKPVVLNPSDMSHAMIAEEFLFDKLYDLDRVKFAPALILDCGAHIGMFTCLAAARFLEAKIVAFEPAPQNLQYLHKQTPCVEGRATVVEAAVSDHRGTMRFTDDISFGGRLTSAASEPYDTFEVKVVDLREFLAKPDSPDRLLLKMDIEGEEENLLPKIVDLLPPTCAFFIETHEGRASWERVTALLEPLRFATCLDRERDNCIDGFAIRQA